MSGLQELQGLTNIEIQKYLDECPYSCKKGKIYIPSIQSFESCPHCSEIYEKISEGKIKDSNGKDIYKILSIPNKYRNIEFESSALFNKNIIENTSEKSRSEILLAINEIENSLRLGNSLKKDYLFYLGVETDLLPLIFTLLRLAYSKGMNVVPYVNTLELIQLFKLAEEPSNSGYAAGKELEKELGVTYMDYCKSDICIVSIVPSAGQNSINMLYTLLKARRARDLKTIVFSETLGVSRELGYVLNNEDFIKCFIDTKEILNTREDFKERSYQGFSKNDNYNKVIKSHVNRNYGVVSETNNVTFEEQAKNMNRKM